MSSNLEEKTSMFIKCLPKIFEFHQMWTKKVKFHQMQIKNIQVHEIWIKSFKLFDIEPNLDLYGT